MRMNRNWGFSSYRLGLYSLTPESIEGIYPNRYKPGEIIKDRENVVPWDLDLDAADGAAQRAVERRSQDGVSGEADARMRRRCAGRRFRADVEPVRIVWRQSRLQRDRRGIDCHPARSIIRARCCSSAMAMRCKATASRPAPASKRRWPSSSPSRCARKSALTGPRVETSEHIISVGSQPEFASSTNRGLQMATSDMVNWLTSEYKMEPWAAHLLIGYQGRYDIVTVAGSVGLKIPRNSCRLNARALFIAVAPAPRQDLRILREPGDRRIGVDTSGTRTVVT